MLKYGVICFKYMLKKMFSNYLTCVLYVCYICYVIASVLFIYFNNLLLPPSCRYWFGTLVYCTASCIVPSLLGLSEAYAFLRYGFTYRRLCLSLVLKGVIIVAAHVFLAWFAKRTLTEYMNIYNILLMILGYLWTCFHYAETTPFGR